MSCKNAQGVPYPTEDAPVARRYQFQGANDVAFPETNTRPKAPAPSKKAPVPKTATAAQVDQIINAAVDKALKARE